MASNICLHFGEFPNFDQCGTSDPLFIVEILQNTRNPKSFQRMCLQVKGSDFLKVSESARTNNSEAMECHS